MTSIAPTSTESTSPPAGLDRAVAVINGKGGTLKTSIVSSLGALIAESGTVMMCTNEGNGRLTSSIPPVHVVLAGIEKLVPTLEDAATILRVLARSATGQEMSVYTTLSTGPTTRCDGFARSGRSRSRSTACSPPR